MERLLKVLLIAALFVVQTGFSQAWLKKAGEGYAQIGFSTLTGKSIYNGTEEELGLNRTLVDNTIQLYGEYAVSDKFTVITSIPYKLISTGEEVLEGGYLTDTLPAGSKNGLGNITLSGVYGLKQMGSVVASLELKTTLFTSSVDENLGIRTGYQAWGIAPTIHLGRGGKYFTSLDLGTNFRTNGYSTQIQSQFQVGRQFKDKIYAILLFGLQASLEDGDAADGNSRHTGLYTNDISYFYPALKFGYALTDNINAWAFMGGGLWGVDVIRAPSFSFSLSYEW